MEPFEIAVPQADVDDLHRRLDSARLPEVPDPTVEEQGVSVAWLRRAVDHWREDFDWRAHEAEINAFPQVMVRVREMDLHVLHVRAGTASRGAILLLHGWPDSVLRYRRVAGPFAQAGFDVVVPSLPGFGFSTAPAAPLRLMMVADALLELMRVLGHDRFAVAGGDWGAALADLVAARGADHVTGLVLGDIPATRTLALARDELTGEERQYLDGADRWFAASAYRAVQSAEPTALAAGLVDSPVGLLAWLGAKLRGWTDGEPDIDRLLAHVSLHWFAGDARSAMRLYAEGMGPEEMDAAARLPSRLEIPTVVSAFHRDLVVPVRALAERLYDLRLFSVHAPGGHFGPEEHPEAFVADVLALPR